MAVAIVSSSVEEKSVKRGLIVTDVLRLAAAVMRKTNSICFYFYLTLSFASFGQKKYKNCELMSNKFVQCN